MGPVGAKTKKATNFGRTPALKKDGYAKGPVPESMVGTKPGVDSKHGYSGPTVAEQGRE